MHYQLVIIPISTSFTNIKMVELDLPLLPHWPAWIVMISLEVTSAFSELHHGNHAYLGIVLSLSSHTVLTVFADPLTCCQTRHMPSQAHAEDPCFCALSLTAAIDSRLCSPSTSRQPACSRDPLFKLVDQPKRIQHSPLSSQATSPSIR